jgi:hydroxyacylglutathione hydrolase
MGVSRSPLAVDHLTIHTICNGMHKENCYLIESNESQECVIIDPGSECSFLIASINQLDLKVIKILLTHGHFDHVGAVDALVREYGVACEVSAIEKRLIRQAGIYAYRFNREKLLPPSCVTYLENSEDFYWGGGVIRSLITPGHTSGGRSYVFNDKAVFTGDTLFHSYLGPTNYPESNLADIEASVSLILNALPENGLIFPGHGKSWIIKDAREWWEATTNDHPQFYLFGE